ncbi:Utp14 protein-domain-containing protein [Gloeopeniophorella convolvens]|nr:Utp14 protein-domain-containing protein [Gloeopeniophorella convolvens]
MAKRSKSGPYFSASAASASKSKQRSRRLRGPLRSDVYEYDSQRIRRANVALSLDKEEAIEHGVVSDDDDFSNRRKPRLIGETVDDERIPSDDDEELDSDAAFEESDEERFAGFTFRGPRSKAPRRKTAQASPSSSQEVSLDENEADEEPEEGDPEDFIDILDVLDGRADGELEEGQPTPREGSRETRERAEMSVDEGEDDEDEEDGDGEVDEEEEKTEAMSADEDVNPNALEGLEKFVSSLETSKKRKGYDGFTDPSGPRKRRVVEEKTATGVEGEFTAPTSGQQLQLDDLLASLASQSADVLSLEKSVKVLDPSRSRGAPLSAPLPQRTQERLDREAAYEETKKEVDKWKDVMRQIKDAEHLSFPLQAEPMGKMSNLELAAKFQPSTELETAVDRLLKQAQMREEDLHKTEELKMNHLSVEEVAARRAEVMKTRELMFRAEMKAKRVAKIKSKTYRRLKRRDKERNAAKLGEDSDSEGPESALKRETDRARERATLRHKSTGKWAKAMKRRGELDADQRQDIVEMLERGEKLRKKIQGEEDGDSSDGDSDKSVAALRARAFDELAELKGDDLAAPATGKSKSVFDMKFMQDAAVREQREVDRQVNDFMQELQDIEDAGDGVDSAEASHGDPTVAVERVGGRLSFRPSGVSVSLSMTGSRTPAPSDTSSTTLKSTDLLSASGATPAMSPVDIQTPVVSRSLLSQQSGSAPNPWLTRNGQSSLAGPKKSEVAVSKDSKNSVKSKNKLRKRQKENEDEITKVQDDAVLEISATDLLARPSKSNRQATSAGDGSDEDTEVEEQEKQLKQKKGRGTAKLTAFKQKELVSLAFAGDNVVQEFEEAKRREIEEDAPREVDTSLPGWGSWGGQGTRKAPTKPHFIKKVAGVDPKSRADFGKAHVIISEKRDKKAAKYMLKDLPYPYTSKGQFERSLETPIGKEWNTRLGFQRATLPKVTKKMGTVIKPLEKPS